MPRVLAVTPPGVLYRPIADYGAIGEGRSVALISSDGSLDWWCPGRFDAPSVFARILDAGAGGHYRVAPSEAGAQASMQYVPDTNVLETTHRTSTGVVRVRDFLAFPEDHGVESSVLIRTIEGMEGSVEMTVRFAPRFQYGRVAPRFARAPHHITFARGAGEIMMLRGLDLAPAGPGAVEGRVVVHAGERVELVLRHRHVDTPVPFRDALAHAPGTLEKMTLRRWRDWASRTRVDGPDESLVRRSALALKLLHHEPTGAIVAAATTSLPEEVGGVRNWDYRFTWIRDAALSAKALASVGHHEEASSFAGWLARTVRGDDMRIMYTLTGGTELPEQELHHLEGYRASKPVRIGNGAATQRQLDVYGELFEFADAHGVDHPGWRDALRSLAEWVVDHWREPDSGIWEMRCEPRHFVLSKAMAWVALTKAAEMARAGRMTGDAARWEKEAELIRLDVLENGYDARMGAFAQAYGHPLLDASNLLLPLIGFLDARDPRMVATVDRTVEQLTANGLVYRYLDAGDGLPGGEATFAYCTFWLVEVLALQGRVREARALFDRIAERASPLGLYAEELDPTTGAHLGNYPQGFPHAGLIQAALALRKAEKAANGG